jgi:hypothetical protein
MAMKGKRWGVQEKKPEKGWMGRPKRVRKTGAVRPPVVRRGVS